MHQCTSTSSYMRNGIARDCTFRARSTTIAFWRTTRRTRRKKSSHLVCHRQIFIHLCDLMGWGRGTYDDGVRPSTVLSTAIVIIHSSWRECRGIVQTRSNTRSPTILSHLVSAHPQQKANHPLFSDDNAWTCVSVVKSSWSPLIPPHLIVWWCVCAVGRLLAMRKLDRSDLSRQFVYIFVYIWLD